MSLNQIMKTVLPVVQHQLKKIPPWLVKTIYPAVEDQFKRRVQPWIQKQLTAKPEDMFPVTWDVDKTGKYKLKINVGDFKPENIKIKVKENKVIVEGDHKERSSKKSLSLSENHIISKYFMTEFQLPDGVNHNSVDSSIKDGFVNILASKETRQTPPKSKPK